MAEFRHNRPLERLAGGDICDLRRAVIMILGNRGYVHKLRSRRRRKPDCKKSNRQGYGMNELAHEQQLSPGPA
jgi:hypothetical protein